MTDEKPRPVRMKRAFIAMTVVFGVLFLSADVYAHVVQQSRVDVANSRLDAMITAYAQVAGECDAAEDCDSDSPPVDQIIEDATPSQSSPGLQGPVGPAGRGPYASELLEAVESYCALYGCDGAAGPPGQDGADSVVPGPAGADGANGADGAPGADSTTPGPQGPQGPAGADGKNGADGRSVTAVDCLEDGTWRITYSDGSTSSTPGPCRVAVVPDPEPPTTEE